VILINLLPHRAEKRRRRKVAFFSGIAVAALVGLMVVGLWFAVVQQLTSGQQERNAFLGQEIQTLEAQIRDIAGLKTEIEALKARQKAVEDLQSDRNIPVHLLNELVKQTPEGIYFKSVKQEGQSLNISGVAQTNERVSEFLRNTNNNSEWLERPELIEIRASSAQTADRSQKRLFDFLIRVHIKRQQDTTGAADAASAVPAAKKG
jgi:type IV pilus assembly protein PilN